MIYVLAKYGLSIPSLVTIKCLPGRFVIYITICIDLFHLHTWIANILLVGSNLKFLFPILKAKEIFYT